LRLAREATANRFAVLSAAADKASSHFGFRYVLPLQRLDRYDLAAAALFCILILLVGFTFRDYAISNDEEVQQRYGELIIAYYASLFADQGLFHFRDLYLYGGLFDVIAVGLERILPLETYAVRHLFSALTGVGGIGAAWITARAIGGPRAGLLAAAALATCGIWYGAMFDHTKDIPFAAAMMAALYFLLLIGRELPKPRWHLVAMFGVLMGCALGIRVLGLLLISYAVLVVATHLPVNPIRSWRDAIAFITRSALALTPAFIIAYVIMVAAWPWAGLAALNPLRAIGAFDNFHYPINTVLAGQVYHMADVPRWYVPTYIGIKLTLPLLAGCGLAILLGMLPRTLMEPNRAAWRKQTALVAFAAFFPLVCETIAHCPDFTGMRHFMFTAPPIAVLAGLGLDGTICRLEMTNRIAAAMGVAIVLLFLGRDATTLYRLHPDEYLFFNPLVGGLEGASRRYATDYWVNIMPEAVGDLERFLDQTEPGSNRHSKRRYLVGVCGERLSFEKEADSRLEWTRDWSQADFFIAPTHMNCDRALDGRIVATIRRLGVLIGVVKDRRSLIRSSTAHSG